LQALREKLSLPPQAWVIFALGRLIEKKGFDDLLRAFSQLPPTVGGCPIHLLVAGDGPRFAELRGLSDSLGLSQRVLWLGWQDKPGQYFALANLVVCPSRHEPLGNVILEAWGYGKPVLSTATEGPSELIEHDVNGLLAPPQNPGALSQRLEAVFSNADLTLERLGMEGKKSLELHFSKAAIVNRYLELYRHLSETAS